MQNAVVVKIASDSPDVELEHYITNMMIARGYEPHIKGKEASHRTYQTHPRMQGYLTRMEFIEKIKSLKSGE